MSTCTTTGPSERRRVAERGFERVDVVAVDRAAVRETERADERGHVAGLLAPAVSRDTVGAYERPLSLRTTTTRRPL